MTKEEYDEIIDEYDDSDMFPNGRDYDAEDEDGIQIENEFSKLKHYKILSLLFIC